MLAVELVKILIEGFTLIWNGDMPLKWWHNYFAAGVSVTIGVVVLLLVGYAYGNNFGLKQWEEVLEMKRMHKNLISFIILWVIVEIGYYIYQVASWTPRGIFLAVTMAFIELIIILITYDLPLLSKGKQENHPTF